MNNQKVERGFSRTQSKHENRIMKSWAGGWKSEGDSSSNFTVQTWVFVCRCLWNQSLYDQQMQTVSNKSSAVHKTVSCGTVLYVLLSGWERERKVRSLDIRSYETAQIWWNGTRNNNISANSTDWLTDSLTEYSRTIWHTNGSQQLDGSKHLL